VEAAAHRMPVQKPLSDACTEAHVAAHVAASFSLRGTHRIGLLHHHPQLHLPGLQARRLRYSPSPSLCGCAPLYVCKGHCGKAPIQSALGPHSVAQGSAHRTGAASERRSVEKAKCRHRGRLHAHRAHTEHLQSTHRCAPQSRG